MDFFKSIDESTAPRAHLYMRIQTTGKKKRIYVNNRVNEKGRRFVNITSERCLRLLSLIELLSEW
jgi:hypothetical protein